MPMSSAKKNNTQLERFLRLIEISRDLTSTLDLDTLLFRIVRAAADLTDSKAASILLYDELKNELYFQSSTNLDDMVMRGLIVPVDDSLAGAILKSREPVIVMSTDDDPRHYSGVGESIQYKTESLLGVPLITKDIVVGVLEAINKIEGEFTKDDEQLLSALGAHAAIAIQNTRLFQQTDLISEIVHELRTPLASINTASHLLTRPEISEEQRTSMAATIQNETNRLSDMVSSFLDLARLESGRVQFSKEHADINELLKDSVGIMENRIKGQDLKLVWDLDKDMPPLNCDEDKIKQVILNLISNAVKYNRPQGSVIIGSFNTKSEFGFFVRDTGRGILPEHIDNLFEKFFRVPGSEQVAVGTGLGLSICKKIVDAHGGDIRVESTIGTGTSFAVGFPKN